MPAAQINIWRCEVCGRTELTAEEVRPYCDPVVCPPTGWGDVADLDAVDKQDPDDVLVACPGCASACFPRTLSS